MNADTRLSPHFWLSEFTASQTATRRGINNDPSEANIGNLRQLATLLEAARVLLGAKPILITSGYRSHLLNHVINGAQNSAHLNGRAADFVCPGYGAPIEVCRTLSDAGLPFDKLINEGTWVHIQIAKPGDKPRRQVLTAGFTQRGVTYAEGLA